MALTLFGLIILAIGGLLLVRASSTGMLLLVLASSLMGGSAAILLPALGGSSVPPAIMATMLLAARCLMPLGDQPRALQDAVSSNSWLILFALYGALSALILPRIFEGVIDVMPLRPIKAKDPFVTYPLAYSTQNITVAVYLLMTMVGAIGAHMAAQRHGSEQIIARAAGAIGAGHAVLGFAGVAAAGTPAVAFFDFFRNGSYAQLDQAVSGVVRVAGIFPEPSAYALYGFVWFVFNAELWQRGVAPRWTGAGAVALLAALLLSTSSTAYIGLAAYGVVLAVRKILFPGTLPMAAMVAGIGSLILLVIGALVLRLVQPAVFDQVLGIAEKMTVGKSDSLSGMQRMMWAMQGWHGFIASGGLGVGAGSFRSSSLITAILGSMGVIGILSFLVHLARVLQPLRRSTYEPVSDPRIAAGAAAGWTATLMIVPAALSAASPDPGLLWGLMGGMALGLRHHRSPATAPGSVNATPRHAGIAQA